MNISKKLVLLLVAMMLVTTVLGACSNNQNNTSNNANTTNNDSKKAGENTTQKEDETPENFNPEGLPVVDEKITISVASSAHPNNTRSDWNEKYIFKKLEEETNVHVEWETTPNDGWLEKRNLLLASGDIPDVLFNVGGSGGGSNGEIVQYGSQGVYIPLNDLIEKYAPNIKRIFELRPNVKEELTAPDGNIYSLPRMFETGSDQILDILWISKVWLDQLNLDVPQTTEEFTEVLKAFNENDMNGNGKQDEIPFTFLYDTNPNYGLYGFMGAFGIPDYDHHLVFNDDGKVVYNVAQPEYKEAIKYIHSLYAEGLIDPEAFTQDQTQLNGTMTGEDIIVGSFIGYSPSAISSIDRWKEAEYIPVILDGPNGKKMWSGHKTSPSIGAMVITAANKYPEATIRWIDHTYEEWFSFQMTNGPISEEDEPHNRWQLNADGSFAMTDNKPEGMTGGQWRYLDSGGNDVPYVVLSETWNKREANPNEFRGYDGKNKMEFVTELIEKDILKFNEYPALLHKPEHTESLAQFQTDIGEYAKRLIAKWITQGGVEEDWDDFLNQLNKLGLEEMLSIYQESYDNRQ